MKIIIDAMGGDNAPSAPVEATVRAVNEDAGIEVILTGKEDILKKELDKYSYPADKIKIVAADEIIYNNEEPVKAVRHKKNASVAVGAYLLKNGDGDALISMGSTGALLASGMFIVGRIRGIVRPAIGTLIPTEKGPKMLIDAGANTNCRAINLQQFALMGSIYMDKVMGRKNPTVGLISNGEERNKGDELTKTVYPLLEGSSLNFIGNIEGRDVMIGNADVMVCDGFVGNVILKTVEGMGYVVGHSLKGIFTKNILTKFGALTVMSGINKFKRNLDYREYGGSPLLGMKKPVIKGHGSSDAFAIYNAILRAKDFVGANVTEEIRKNVVDTEGERNG